VQYCPMGWSPKEQEAQLERINAADLVVAHLEEQLGFLQSFHLRLQSDFVQVEGLKVWQELPIERWVLAGVGYMPCP
jgi:collagenase-like PrtC family protease